MRKMDQWIIFFNSDGNSADQYWHLPCFEQQKDELSLEVKPQKKNKYSRLLCKEHKKFRLVF